MGFFKKTISDEEWLAQAKPLHETALPVTTALDEAIANPPLPKDFHKELQDAFSKLSTIAESIKRFPNPTSSDARQAKKNLESAIKDYIKGIKSGLKFYSEADRSGGLGDIYGSRVGLSKLAGAVLAGALSSFLESIKSAQKPMEKVNAYFSNR
jgi:hypothetical protein